MTGLEKMAENILKSMIPPEALKLMTAENIEKAINYVGVALAYNRESLDIIKAQQLEILEILKDDSNRNRGSKPRIRGATLAVIDARGTTSADGS